LSPQATPAAPPQRSPLHAAPAFDDGDISITSETAKPSKSPADILAGAADVLARSSTTPVAAAAAAAGIERASASDTAFTTPAPPSFAQAASDLSTRVDTPSEPTRFDLDFHLDDAERPAPFRPAVEPDSKPEPRHEPAFTPSPAPAPVAHPAGGLDLDKLDLSFDPERPVFEDPTPSVLDGQWHDAATKLDLAKAYQEMGDTDGAREILQEVLHEGDDQQKSEARNLLAKLAS
jgi:pilus assembly protein FimV